MTDRTPAGTTVFAAAPYLNALPLTTGMRDRHGVTLICDRPSSLASYLASAQADAALVPIVDCIANPDLTPLGHLGVAANGPVDSVYLCTCQALDEITCVLPDPESHTSNLLAQLILRMHGHSPRFLSTDPGDEPSDARVVIGDRALMLVQSGTNIDLSAAWKELTGLPFVFAMWAARPDHPWRKELEQLTAACYTAGRDAIPAIAHRFASRLSIPVDTCLTYLQQRIVYEIGPQEQNGLATFHTLLREHELLPEITHSRAEAT